jgi:hypothetical protein
LPCPKPSSSTRRESKRNSQEGLAKSRTQVSQSRWQVPSRLKQEARPEGRDAA